MNLESNDDPNFLAFAYVDMSGHATRSGPIQQIMGSKPRPNLLLLEKLVSATISDFEFEFDGQKVES